MNFEMKQSWPGGNVGETGVLGWQQCLEKIDEREVGSGDPGREFGESPFWGKVVNGACCGLDVGT